MCRVILSAGFRSGLVLLALIFAGLVCGPMPVVLGQGAPLLHSSYTQAEPPRPAAQPAVKVTPEQMGDILMARKQYVSAIAAYREGSQESAVYWNKLGIAYHHLFAITEAKRDYQKAIALDPKYAEAINNLGTIFYAQKDYRQAQRLYQKAIKLAPSSAVSYSNLGTVLIAQRKYKKGAEAYERAFGLDPRVFDPEYAGKVEESGPAAERAKLNFCLAEIYAKAGQKQQALIYLRRALAAGFDDKKKLMEDKELATLREMPEFHLMMASQRLE